MKIEVWWPDKSGWGFESVHGEWWHMWTVPKPGGWLGRGRIDHGSVTTEVVRGYIADAIGDVRSEGSEDG